MGKELLLEIGTEEIPAAFLPKALRDMEEIARRELAANRIFHGEIRTMGTPRRLFLAAVHQLCDTELAAVDRGGRGRGRPRDGGE